MYSNPHGFKHHLIRPSVDASFAGPSSLDDTFLTPTDPRQKLPNSNDEKRHAANKESGVVDVLDDYSIPMYHHRVYKSAGGKTTLTASNVLPEDLTHYYRWGFYPNIQGVTPSISTSVLGNLGHVSIHTLTALNIPVLQLPQDWQHPQDTQESTLKLLKYQMGLIGKAGQNYKYSPRGQVANLPYPNPNVILHETGGKNDPDAALRVEWTMLKILTFPRLHTYRSEMDVERHIGSNIAGFFKIVNCTTSSNTDVAFPTAIGCFGSFPRPDFACRIGFNPLDTLPWSFRPVVLAGEAKRDITASSFPTENAHRYQLAAQLACTLHPTLVLMIVHAMSKWEEARKYNPKAPFRFPFYAIVHGIAYDMNGVLIYGFFPRLLALQEDGTPANWGFGCIVVSTDFVDIFNEPAQARFGFITAMLIIQRHATYLSEQLSRLTLPSEFTKCDKLWKKKGLGCH